MIIFNELRVTKDGSNLVISARVRKESYYDNVYIDKIIVDTEDTYIEGGPSSKPYYSKSFDVDNKEVSITINGLETLGGFRGHLLFVYVVTKGEPSPTTPCGLDERTTLGVTTYMKPLYDNFMADIKTIGNTCEIPSNFIDNYLKYKALNVSIDSGHYLEGINIFNQWFKNSRTVHTIQKCGCHG